MHIETGLSGDARCIHCFHTDDILDFLRDFIGNCARQVNLVDDGHDFQIVVECKIDISQRLGFHTLRRVDNEHRPVAGSERTRNFIIKVDMAGSINQVEDILFPVIRTINRADCLGFDRNASLPLQIHVVEDLVLHFTLCEKTCHLNDAVGEGGLAVVDVGYYTEIADFALIHEGSFFRDVTSYMHLIYFPIHTVSAVGLESS